MCDDGESGLVVVVDRSMTSRKILEVCLSRAGYRVITYASGIEAYKRLVGMPEQPDLLLIDFDLQPEEMSSYELVRQLKTHSAFSTVPLLFLSRRGGVVDRLKARLAGGAGMIPKPFVVKHLVEAVQTYLPKEKIYELPTEHMPSIQRDNSADTPGAE